MGSSFLEKKKTIILNLAAIAEAGGDLEKLDNGLLRVQDKDLLDLVTDHLLFLDSDGV